MIRTERHGAIATVSIDRGAARNALSIEGWRLLAEAFAALAGGAATLVVLRSAVPGIFSAGADLVDLARLADRPEERPVFRDTMRAAIDAFAALPMPTVAAVEGGCYGAAVALALAADLRIVSPAARFAVPPARLGIGYPAADVARLAGRVGQGQAARLLFTAATIDADESLRIGLVDAIGDPDVLVASVAANDPAALRLLKRTLAAPGDPTLDTAFDACFGGPAFLRRLAAFRGRTAK